jgi:uncharacterized protein (TIGR02231 family)
MIKALPMKPSRFLAGLFAGFVLGAAFSAAASVPAESRITAVTVYPDRAVATRTGKVNLSTGVTEVLFDRLPATLVDASLQISARGTAAATLLDVSVRQTFVEASPSMRVRALEDELAGLRRQDVVLADNITRVDQQQALVGRIETAMTTPVAGEQATPRPSFDDWQRLLAFQTEHLARLATERQGLRQQRQELTDKIAAVEQQLNVLRGQQPGGRSYKAVVVRVAASEAGDLELTLGYAVPGASWTPAYDARLHTASRQIEFTYHGVVRNGTGEDWNQIALTLSTARPNLGGGAPEVPAWIVDEARPMPLARESDVIELSPFMVQSERVRGGRDLAVKAAAAPEPRTAAIATAAVESSATSATFRISEPVTLPSDNTTQKVAVTTLPLRADLHYEAAPKLVEAAFLTAKATNTSEFPFLAGSLNAFLDETFVATSRLKTVMPGESFDLALGADDGIAVKRRLVNRFNENTGLMSSGRRITYDILVTLTNNKRTAEKIVFREAVPVSRHEKIVVKQLTPAERDIGTLSAPREITREEDGRLAWRVELAPGEKREFPLKFSIEHPADLPVAGLD